MDPELLRWQALPLFGRSDIGKFVWCSKKGLLDIEQGGKGHEFKLVCPSMHCTQCIVVGRSLQFIVIITLFWARRGTCWLSPWRSVRSTYYVACRCLCGLLHPKKKPHTRDAPATPLHCRQWSNQILLSCGALLAVHDGLRFAVRVSGRFLRSAVFLCLA